MPKNAITSLKRTRRSSDPVRDYDNLPQDLRRWVATAALPWGAKSVKTAYDKAVRRTGDPRLALRELDKLQQNKVAKDAQQIWGQGHPALARFGEPVQCVRKQSLLSGI